MCEMLLVADSDDGVQQMVRMLVVVVWKTVLGMMMKMLRGREI